MVKTGRTVNFLLGHGDSARFSLLGGTMGEAGDVVMFHGGSGTRFFPDIKDTILRATQGGASSGGSGVIGTQPPSTGPRRQPDYRLQ